MSLNRPLTITVVSDGNKGFKGLLMEYKTWDIGMGFFLSFKIQNPLKFQVAAAFTPDFLGRLTLLTIRIIIYLSCTAFIRSRCHGSVEK